MTTVLSATLADLPARTLYEILALRSAVFVVEQDCAYPDIDGRDTEPGALLLWAEHDGRVVATARLLRDPDGAARIGRVATAPQARGRGLAADIVRHAQLLAGEVDIVLDAQSQLRSWYEDLGFAVAGAEFDEDGIAHLPMRRSVRSVVREAR